MQSWRQLLLSVILLNTCLLFHKWWRKMSKIPKTAVFRGAEAARFVFRGFLDFFFSWTAVLRIELESPLYNLHHFLRWKKLEPEKGWWHYVQVFLTPMSSIHRCSNDMQLAGSRKAVHETSILRGLRCIMSSMSTLSSEHLSSEPDLDFALHGLQTPCSPIQWYRKHRSFTTLQEMAAFSQFSLPSLWQLCVYLLCLCVP